MALLPRETRVLLLATALVALACVGVAGASSDHSRATAGACPPGSVATDGGCVLDAGVQSAPPDAAFWGERYPEPGEQVTYDGGRSSDDGEVVSYLWYLDGDPVGETRTFTTTWSDGTHNLTLVVEDDDGQTDSLSETIVVGENTPPTADFTYDPSAPVPGESIAFDGTVSSDDDGQVFFWEWYVDGQFAAESSAFDESLSAGTHNVTLVVQDDDQATDRITRFVEVGQNDPPEPSFTYTPTPAIVDQSVTFDASASSDPDGTVEYFEWDFQGDGQVDVNTTDRQVAWTFPTTGTYLVMVTAVDDDGARRMTEQNVEVVRPAPTAACTVEPTTVRPGETVTIDASGSENATFVEFDLDGDGQYETGDETDFVVQTSYDEPGEYTVVVRARNGDRSDTIECTVVVGENEPPRSSFTVSDSSPTVGDSVTFDASASSDPDGTVVAYRWDFDDDGTTDATTTSPTVTRSFDSPGGRVVSLTVVDDENATDATSRDLGVQRPPPTAACTVEPTTVRPGETVTIDASGSENAAFVEFDLDGDGQYETSDETDFVVQTSFDEVGEYTVVVRARNGDRSDTTECTVVVERPRTTTVPPTTTAPPTTPQNTTAPPPGTTPAEQEGDQDPLLPLPWPWIAGGAAAVAIGYGAWRYFPRGGGPEAKRPRKPRAKSSETVTPRYDAGVFAVPPTSGTVAVDDVGFEPDLVVLTATNAARADQATDRTAGWSRGTAWLGGDDPVQQSVTVADDAASTDQGTVATTSDAALDLVRHDDGLHGRIRARVQSTNAYGFDVEVSVPGEDPTAGGIRVLYQAFRTASDADVEAGQFLTPTEPGGQVVPLGVDADHVSLVASSSVGDLDRTWTTDRSVGLSVGTVVGREDLAQTVWNGTVDPSPENHRSAAGSAEHALHLLYQDADDIAGRTTAAVTATGEELRLRYDRVYSGPHKLGSVARHVVQYLAMDTGESMTPATGVVRLPAPGETVQVDCGFAPALVEFTTCGLDDLGDERVADAAAEPFGWSRGAAIVRGDVLEQYVLHGSTAGGVPERGPLTDAAGAAMAGTGTAGETAADGGKGTTRDGLREGRADHSERDSTPAPGTTDATPTRHAGTGLHAHVTDPGLSRGPGSFDTGVPTDVGAPDVVDALAEPDAADGPHALRHGGDGVVGAWLTRDADGVVDGREEFRVRRRTDHGFVLGVGDVSAGGDAAAERESRPFVFYRAWPDPDLGGQSDESTASGTGGSRGSTGGGSTDAVRTGREPTTDRQSSEDANS